MIFGKRQCKKSISFIINLTVFNEAVMCNRELQGNGDGQGRRRVVMDGNGDGMETTCVVTDGDSDERGQIPSSW